MVWPCGQVTGSLLPAIDRSRSNLAPHVEQRYSYSGISYDTSNQLPQLGLEALYVLSIVEFASFPPCQHQQLLQVVPQFPASTGMPHFSQGFRFYLTNTFPGHCKFPPHLL